MPDFFSTSVWLTQMMLTTEFYNFNPKFTRSLFNHPNLLSLVGFLSLAEHLVGLEPMNLIVITMP